VQVVHQASGYQLLRGGKPFFIKGAAGLQYYNLLREYGGNSVRIYTENYADVLLDEAQRQDLTVMLGLWLKPPYEKFDYYDTKAVAAQNERVYQQVQRFKNHPALLMWNLGNELDNRTRDLKVYQILNEVAQTIHRLDPNHPVTTTITSSPFSIPAIVRLCPDIDVLTINVFGSLAKQPAQVVAAGWTRPFIIGEFGAPGWWEAPQTSWNAPLDLSGSAKADSMATGYQAAINGYRAQCLGSYALYWGNRFEQTDMWLSLLGPTGEKTPQTDILHYLWTGQKVANQAPHVSFLHLAGKRASEEVVLRPNADYPASISAWDPEGDSLRVAWRVTPDVDEFNTLPQARTAPESMADAISSSQGLTARVHTPAQRGAYRLLVDVHDEHGSVTNHSLPFFVGKPDHPERGIHMPAFSH
jgi:hypothetical protein